MFSSPIVSRAPRVLLSLPALQERLYHRGRVTPALQERLNHRGRVGGWALLCVVSGWPCVPPVVLQAPGEQGLSAELTGPTPWQWKRSGQPGSWDGAPGAPHPHCVLLSRWTGMLWAARVRAGRQGLS